MNVPHPEAHSLRAAIGWTELGCPLEALAELDQIPAPWRTHPQVLDTEWQVHASRLDWSSAHAVACTLVTLHPGFLPGWIHRAYAARRQPGGSLSKAFAALVPAAQKFPDDGLIRYNLACYTAQMGELETAWHWFEEALHRQPNHEGAASYRDMALNDEDLKPLWPRIRKAA